MRNNVFIVIRFFFFWLIFFFLERLTFLLYFPAKLKLTNLTEFSNTFLYGIRLDASMAAYISVIPLLGFVFYLFIPKIKLPVRIPKFYTRTLIILFSLIAVINFNIYREWGSKINYRALDFAFNAPNEAFASSASSPVLSSLLVFFLLVLVGFLLERRIVRYNISKKGSYLNRTIFSLLLAAFAFLIIRGGWQLSPVNESMAYFSQKPFLNHAAINTEWSLFRNILNNKSRNKNPYTYYKSEAAKKIIANLYKKPEAPTPQYLTTQRPNVVFIILESFTANVIESFGGEKGVAPNMEKLIKEGLSFSNIYASGDRTDKGTVALLSGFPSQGIRSVIKENSKQEKLPSLAQSLSKNGYSTSFYYGGESEFFNMKSYIMSHAYQQLIDKSSFEKKDMNSKWGAYDEVVFEKQKNDLKSEKQPFFSTILTLTNHEPFELPDKHRFGENTDAEKFRSTAYYTDSCLNAFINNSKKETWYKNTLFVIVADHGHRLPTNKYEIYHPFRYKIPLLFFGDVIKQEYRGKIIGKIGSQTDVAATLLSQLNIDYSAFKWSKDLLNQESLQFSFFDWDNGFGLVMPEQIISFDNVGKNIIYQQNKVSDDINRKNLTIGKAYMQQVFQDYLDL